MSNNATIARPDQLSVRFGPADTPCAEVGLPCLAGRAVEEIFPDAEPAGRTGVFSLFRCGDWLLGRAGLPAGVAMEDSARRLYETLLQTTRSHHLVRVWNYVPAINGSAIPGLENYQAFCRGRSVAFETEFGPDFKRFVPAASAVGSEDPNLIVIFASNRSPARHLENPWQVPAYEYPAAHGPRSPTFARASTVPTGDGTHAVFISGTAAIRGHDTVAPGETLPQLDCTLENLQVISRICGLGSDLGAGRSAARHAKVYVRHAEDMPGVRQTLEKRLFQPDDHVSYLRAEICRRDLNVEIEFSILGARLE